MWSSYFFPYFPLKLLVFNGCNSFEICGKFSALVFLFVLGAVIFVSGIFSARAMSKGWLKFASWLVVILIPIILILLFSVNETRCSNYNAKRKLLLSSIVPAQEIYFSEHGRYARDFKDLRIEPIKDPRTGQILSGDNGVDLGQNNGNPDNWSIRSFIEDPQYNSCQKVNSGYWYRCDRSGCQDIK